MTHPMISIAGIFLVGAMYGVNVPGAHADTNSCFSLMSQLNSSGDMAAHYGSQMRQSTAQVNAALAVGDRDAAVMYITMGKSALYGTIGETENALATIESIEAAGGCGQTKADLQDARDAVTEANKVAKETLAAVAKNLN